MSRDKWDIYNKKPVEFLKRVLLPAFKRVGITSDEAISNELTFLLPNTTGAFYQSVFKNLSKSNSIRNRASAIGTIENAKADPSNAASKRFTEAIKTFQDAFGKFNEPAVIVGLNMTSAVLEHLANALSKMSLGSFGTKLGLTNPLTASTILAHSAYDKMKPYIAKVEIDGKKAGNAIVKHVSGNQLVQDGTTGANASHTGYSNAYNGQSGGMSQ